jgi:hypothetical protein
MEKIINYQVSSKFVAALESMYNIVKQCVRYNGKMSEFSNAFIGLKQGDPSSSLMFLLFNNDILQNIDTNLEGIFTLKFFPLMFADDAALFAHSPETLQSMLNDLNRYCHTWGLTISTNKTKVMVFERGRHTQCNICLNNIQLEVVPSFKYLGTHLFKNGSWYRTQIRISKHSSFAHHNLIFNQIE